MKCAVANCRSDNHSKASNCSFYIFPSNMELAKKWVEFCRREDYFNPKTSFICMKHFTRGDFGNSLQFEMGYARNRLLKRGAVPSIYENLPEGSDIKTTSTQRLLVHDIHIAEPCVKENLKIINLVKTNPLVYTSPSMKVRHAIWEKIDAACGFKKHESKKRWDRLLSDFYVHTLKVFKKTPPNDGLPTPNNGSIKLHDYRYFKEMLFVMPYIKSIVIDAKLKAIQEDIKKEEILAADMQTNRNMESETELEAIDISADIAEDTEKPSTSKSLTVTSRKKAHMNYVTNKQQDESPIEINIDNKVYKIQMSTSEDSESPNYDFQIKQSTMTERKQTTPYENLSLEEKSLKAFFDAMLDATQRLPEFHQRRIKGDLVKALRHRGVNITE
ncbi:PREDICTED: uncharacterized protein LOC108967409 isoform X2 [Bactrocera latifrons]|uniref:uncharacterized protein LOC108967409 isoform X2 n=1 Tax=Bactrocera latifrons TaxID=174628 RepID=UPI0008DEA3D3|nr:PREDICTED: uncharacterized protein LOC108967409 isoform X2 [Bactrocera latifrons]